METNKTNAPIQGVQQSGWYAAQDDGLFFYIDQWCNFGNVLMVHTLKEWCGDKDVEVKDKVRWYSDYEFEGDKPMLLATKEECMAADDSAQSFRKAKKEADSKGVKDNLIAALKAFAMHYDHTEEIHYDTSRELEKVLKELDVYECCLCDEEYKTRVWACTKAIDILRSQNIRCDFTGDGYTCIPLASISRVSNKDEAIIIEMHTGQKYSVSKKNDNTLYGALSRVFNV